MVRFVPFNTIHSGLLQTRYKMHPVTSAQIMAIPATISMILTPFAGMYVDKYGQRVHGLMLASISLIVIHMIIGLTDEATCFVPYVPLTALGFTYSFLLLF
jgi:nitrate/nitrite transporter NarK